MRLAAKSLRYGAGGTTIVDGVDIAVEPGRLTGLIGPNGAGKTTLLRLLAGLLEPQAGEIRLGDEARTAPRARARSLAYLAQGGDVAWAMSVEALVALGRLPHRRLGGPSADDRRAVEEAIARCDIGHLRSRTVATLSGGERSRVLLARALAVEAPLLLADEPVTALDPYHQLAVMEMLRREADGGKGVVVVLHDLTLAHRFCDELVLLEHGRVAASGEPAEVLGGGTVRRVYRVAFHSGEAPGGSFVVPWQRL
ncbi:ABC transporter ATP-binding protein [Aureimonas mangrovi]|uniref:ABC transporter ATP-binding protein n=1 Tax=Aureimonas mangrovi TaxID=2758041 RepID=UPI00163D6B0D|nr:ABC transporter ATP-binding protein [Aureimonas mangrovi]